MAAFSANDAAKTKDTLIYERNTHRKQARELREERDMWECRYTAAEAFTFTTLKELVVETGGAEPAKRALWNAYGKYPKMRREYTKDTTGAMTHKGTAKVLRKGEEVEIEAHLTPTGAYYKPWKKDDKPAYYLENTACTPENFTMDDKGELKPIKKY